MTDEITDDLITSYVLGETDVPLDPRYLGRVLLVATPEQTRMLWERISIEMNLIEARQLRDKAEAAASFYANTRPR